MKGRGKRSEIEGSACEGKDEVVRALGVKELSVEHERDNTCDRREWRVIVDG